MKEATSSCLPREPEMDVSQSHSLAPTIDNPIPPTFVSPFSPFLLGLISFENTPTKDYPPDFLSFFTVFLDFIFGFRGLDLCLCI